MDAPTAAALPPYASTEFEQLLGAECQNLTQDNLASPSPLRNDNAMGDNREEGYNNEDPDGNDFPLEPSAFDNPNFDLATISNDLKAMDHFSLLNVSLNPFTSTLRVPALAAEDWTRAHYATTSTLVMACDLPLSDPSRYEHILRAAK